MANEIKISAELRMTVLKKDSIKEVHFDSKGRHFFNVHSHNGKQYPHIPQQSILNKQGKPEVVRAPIIGTHIVKTMSRAEILGDESNDQVINKIESEASAHEEKLLSK